MEDTVSTNLPDWQACYRIFSNKFPPEAIWESYDYNANEIRDFLELINLTRSISHNSSELSCIDPQDYVFGEGASWIMGCFTHIGKPSRFTDGRYGVFYGSDSIETSIKEKVFHLESERKNSKNIPDEVISQRVIQTRICEKLHTINPEEHLHLLSPDTNDYPRPQAFALKLKESKSWGILYPSVRNPSGQCAAIFRPRALKAPYHVTYIRFFWSAQKQKITHVENHFPPDQNLKL